MKFQEYVISIDKAITEMRLDIDRQFFMGSPFATRGHVTAAKDVDEPTVMGGLDTLSQVCHNTV